MVICLKVAKVFCLNSGNPMKLFRKLSHFAWNKKAAGKNTLTSGPSSESTIITLEIKFLLWKNGYLTKTESIFTPTNPLPFSAL